MFGESNLKHSKSFNAKVDRNKFQERRLQTNFSSFRVENRDPSKEVVFRNIHRRSPEENQIKRGSRSGLQVLTSCVVPETDSPVLLRRNLEPQKRPVKKSESFLKKLRTSMSNALSSKSGETSNRSSFRASFDIRGEKTLSKYKGPAATSTNSILEYVSPVSEAYLKTMRSNKPSESRAKKFWTRADKQNRDEKSSSFEFDDFGTNKPVQAVEPQVERRVEREQYQSSSKADDFTASTSNEVKISPINRWLDASKRLSKSLTALPSDISYENTLKPSKITKDYNAELDRVLTTNRLCRNDTRMRSFIVHKKKWVSSEEASEYGKEQKPPFVIPRIRQITPRKYTEEEGQNEEPKSPSIKDVCRKFEEEIMNKAHNEFGKMRTPNKLGVHNDLHEKHNFLQHAESSPIVLRKSADGLRVGKAKSMITGDKKEQSKYFPQVLPRAYESNMPVLREGTLNRTKLIENGRKVRKKNWQREYAVMTQTSLAFYKDKKTYESVRDSPEKSISINPEIIKLRGSVAGKTTTQQTSRSNAIVITSDPSTQYLIHHEDPAVAQSWLNDMTKAINKLPSDYKCPENINLNTPLVGTPSPTHKHVSKIKSSKVIEGSVEDLTDLPEHAVIRSKLKKFFNRRPTVESLIKSKIYEDEPIFGRKLEQVCPDTNPRVPEFVMKCIKVIESSEENMSSDGLYRASGNLSQVQKIRVEVNQNNMSVLEKEPDVNVLTGALKLFFRELKEPLIPFKLFQPCLNASSNPSPEARIKEFREIVDSLPECNKQTLKYLLEHLLRVTARKDKNRMHISNIAIVLGPTLLLAPPEASQNMAFECLQQNRVIEILMSDFDKIFKEDGKRRK